MEKIKEISSSLNHSFSVTDRKNIVITGVVKIDSFDSEEFLIETIQGFMNIKGEGLDLVKLDTFQGCISIKGKINAVFYLEENEKKESFVTRLFK